MAWFKKKVTCTRCNKNKTKRDFEGTPTCAACKTALLVAKEPKRACPVDGSTLLKEHNDEIIIDRCQKCRGVWLDAGELDAIKEAAQSEGLVVGLAL